VATATAPSAIGVLFMPYAIHIFPEHESDFCALVIEVLADTDTLKMSAEYANDHWMPSG